MISSCQTSDEVNIDQQNAYPGGRELPGHDGWRGLRSSAVPSTRGRSTKRNSSKIGELPYLELHIVKELRLERYLLDTGRPPGVIAKPQAFAVLPGQNADLGAKEWIVVRGSNKSAHFAALIDGASLEALKTYDFLVVGWIKQL
ncbi:hypothetical protein G5I_08689 [Acromyrmex echinatior]|uniref:Uncharacterized protein n=1 Tax=Acromyrmex echinatior TaxID=103372 RepID=F4WS74_ACREC|nr:hypothetical protein G5I_08689 [Acromyrmex echinatior]